MHIKIHNVDFSTLLLVPDGIKRGKNESEYRRKYFKGKIITSQNHSQVWGYKGDFWDSSKCYMCRHG